MIKEEKGWYRVTKSDGSVSVGFYKSEPQFQTLRAFHKMGEVVDKVLILSQSELELVVTEAIKKIKEKQKEGEFEI